jgi:hypothetical protein
MRGRLCEAAIFRDGNEGGQLGELGSAHGFLFR